MVDIHSHILPGVDDGAGDIEESVDLAELSASEGTTVIFATPHVAPLQDRELALQLPERVAALQDAIVSRGLPLRLVQGAEVYPDCGVLAALDAGLPLTLGGLGKHLLLDLPLTAIPLGFEQLVFDLQRCGITPILAHPERAIPVQMQPQMLEPLVHRGLLLQIDAGSMLGSHGPAAESAALMLLRHKWVQFVASDAHSPRVRRPRLADAARVLTRILGLERVTELISTNGRRVLEGEAIPTNPADYSPKRSRWRMFGG
ncbi:MAG: phosphotransferase [Armatimonadetes bacterium]|nr:phosphotransferase [Armatimonadota bacterium]